MLVVWEGEGEVDSGGHSPMHDVKIGFWYVLVMAWRHSCILTCLYLYIFIYLRVLIFRYKHLFRSLPRLPTPAEIYVRRVW